MDNFDKKTSYFLWFGGVKELPVYSLMSCRGKNENKLLKIEQGIHLKYNFPVFQFICIDDMGESVGTHVNSIKM